MKTKNYKYKLYLRDRLEPIELNRTEGLKLMAYRTEGGGGRIQISERYPELDTDRIVLLEKAFVQDDSGKIEYKEYSDKEKELIEKLQNKGLKIEDNKLIE